MSLYADSSALVKLYVDEADPAPPELLTGVLVVSQLARVEVPSAFWRKHRMGELPADDAAVLSEAFELDYFGHDEADARFVAVASTAHVLERAARLVAVHRLRALDGVQLASAVAARAAGANDGRIAAFDLELRRAAAAEGFALLPTTM